MGGGAPPPTWAPKIFKMCFMNPKFVPLWLHAPCPRGTIDTAGRGVGGRTPLPPDMGSEKFQNVLHESVFCSLVATCTLSTGYGLATIHNPLFQFRGCSMTHTRPDGTIKIRPGPDCFRPILAIDPISKRPIRSPYLISTQAAVPCGAS